MLGTFVPTAGRRGYFARRACFSPLAGGCGRSRGLRRPRPPATSQAEELQAILDGIASVGDRDHPQRAGTAATRRILVNKKAARREDLAAGNSWWRQWGSNPRPQACKARALPAELCPRCVALTLTYIIIAPAATRLTLGRLLSEKVVGLTRFELVTSRLSAGRSDQLSYRPNARSYITRTPTPRQQLF